MASTITFEVSKPTFSFMANSSAPLDKSGVATWRYTEQRHTGEVEVVVRQTFEAFEAAHALNQLVAVAFAAGEGQGYACCERKVLDAMRT